MKAGIFFCFFYILICHFCNESFQVFILKNLALLILHCVLDCAVGAKANVPNVGCRKIELKKCAVEKIKNTEALEMSVCLVVVPLQIKLTVCRFK
jgi:hypothetical protein